MINNDKSYVNTIVIQKLKYCLSVNNIANFYFLTDGANFVKKYGDLSFFNFKNLKDRSDCFTKGRFKKTGSLSLRRNFSFFFRTVFTNRHRVKFNFFLMRAALNYNPYLIMVKQRRIPSPYRNVKSNFSFFLHRHYLLNGPKLASNWFFLVGGLISPFYWEFQNKKRWLRRRLQFNVTPNLNLSRFSKLIATNDIISNANDNKKLLFKKLYFNNIFFFSKLNLNFADLKYFIKLGSLRTLKNTADWSISRPYLFLNNHPLVFGNHFFTNSLLYSTFRLYSRLFRFSKRKTRVVRFWFDYWFKTYSNLNNNKNFAKYATHRPGRGSFLKSKPLTTLFYGNGRVTDLVIIRDSEIIKYHPGRMFRKVSKRLVFLRWLLLRTINPFYIRKRKISQLLLRRVRPLCFKSSNYSFITTLRTSGLGYSFYKKLLSYFNPIKNDFKSRKIFTRKMRKLALTTLLYPRFKNIKSYSFFKNTISYKFTVSSATKVTYLSNFYKMCTPALSLSHKSINDTDPRWFSFKTLKRRALFDNLKVKSYISYFIKLPLIFNKFNTRFIGTVHSFLFLSNNIIINDVALRSQSPHIIKKILYSFALKNETQRYILRRYVKNRVSSLIYNKSLSLRTYKDVGYYKNLAKFSFSYNDDFFKNSTLLATLSTSRTLLYRNFLSKKWSTYDTFLDFSADTGNSRFSNISIKRVKFKPGYMILWRNAREVLKQSMNLNFRYQHKLTRYVSKFKNFINFKFFVHLEMQLLNILLKSRITPDLTTANLFITNGLVYLNGYNCYNPLFQLFPGDFIQLIVSLKYYVLHRWMLNWVHKRRLRLRGKARAKLTHSGQGEEKQRSHLLPSWILFSKYTIEDVAKFLEVDYTTLSVFVLYEPFLWNDINPYTVLGTRFGIINLYNWKYIT